MQAASADGNSRCIIGCYSRPGSLAVQCSQYSVWALGRGSVGYARGRSKQYGASIYFKKPQLNKAFCRCAIDVGGYTPRKKRAKVTGQVRHEEVLVGFLVRCDEVACPRLSSLFPRLGWSRAPCHLLLLSGGPRLFRYHSLVCTCIASPAPHKTRYGA